MMKLSGNFKKLGGIDKAWKVQLGLYFFKCTLYLNSYMISTTICVNSQIFNFIVYNQNLSLIHDSPLI